MSNSKEIINISSSSDKNFESIRKETDVPSSSGPSKVPSKKRTNPWSQRYKNFWKKGKAQKIAIVVISSSDESEEDEFENEETEEELEEEEEEEEEEEPEEEPMEDINNQMDLEDAIWGQDPIPTTSGDSLGSRVGFEPVVASPLPRIQSEEHFQANCTWSL